MSWKKDTQQLATDAATHYYDNALAKGKYPGEFNVYRDMSREEAIKELAKRYVGKLREAVPEKDYDENMARKVSSLDAGVVSKYMFEFGEEPFGASRKANLDDVVDKWYSWSPKETESQMYRFGYDPNRKGDLQKFLAEIRDAQTQHDRAKIVDESVNNAPWYDKVAMAMLPSTTKEATRQALTGDFDDFKKNRALVADILANGAMTLAPSVRLLSNPVGAGLAAAGAETARQAIQPTEFEAGAPLLAGTAAATVPGVGQYIQGMIGRGASTGARQFSRQFAKGLRGADDPVVQERNALEKLLTDARKQSQNAEKAAELTDGNPVPSVASIPGLETAEKWAEAESKLNALGYSSAERVEMLNNRLDLAAKKLTNAKKGRNKASIAEAQKEYDDAVAAIEDYQNRAVLNYNLEGDDALVEGVIGKDPSLVQGGPVRVVKSYADKNGIKRALDAYDKPPVFFGANENVPQVTGTSLTSYGPMRDLYRNAFPAKYEDIIAGANGGRLSKFGYGLGRGVGGIGGRLEPAMGISISDLLTGNDATRKTTNFRESKWYKNLTPNKKNIIEKALRGE